jgi:hypothetical protein
MSKVLNNFVNAAPAARELITTIVDDSVLLNAKEGEPYERTVDIIANVTKIQIYIESVGTATTHAYKKIKKLYIEAAGQPPIYNVSGEELLSLMAAKYPGECLSLKPGSLYLAAAFELDITDFAGKLQLSVPAQLRTLTLKIEWNEFEGGSEDWPTEITTIVTQDKSVTVSSGFRRYLTQTVRPSCKAGEFFTVDLPKMGVLDSLFLIYDKSAMTLSTIEIEKDADKFPYRSNVKAARAFADLRNDEGFPDDDNIRTVYVDLARPVGAKDAGSLKLRAKNAGSNLTGVVDLKLLFEYVHETSL